MLLHLLLVTAFGGGCFDPFVMAEGEALGVVLWGTQMEGAVQMLGDLCQLRTFALW